MSRSFRRYPFRWLFGFLLLGIGISWRYGLLQAQVISVDVSPTISQDIVRVHAAQTAPTSTYTLMVFTSLLHAVHHDADVRLGGPPLVSFDEWISSNLDARLYFRARESSAEDFDGDGLSNIDEAQLGLTMTKADSDGDGLSDGDEVNHYQTDPLEPDTDSDGRLDGDDLFPHGLFAGALSAQDGSPNPVLATNIPRFSAMYQHPQGKPSAGYIMEVSRQPDFTVLEWRAPSGSGFVPAVIADGQRSPDIAYGGIMTNEGLHYWRIRFVDEDLMELPYSPDAEHYVYYQQAKPELTLFAEDIEFSDNQPDTNQSVFITAKVRNTGLAPAYLVGVRFLVDDVAFGSEEVVPVIAPGEAVDVTVPAAFAEEGVRLVESRASLSEYPEVSAAASRMLYVGPTGATIRLIVSAGLSSPLCRGLSQQRMQGNARYDVTRNGITNAYPAKGAAITAQIPGYLATASRTDITGAFGIYIPGIFPDGAYIMEVNATDGTLSDTYPFYFFANGNCPTNAAPPPAPDAALSTACEMDLLNISSPFTSAMVRVRVWNSGDVATPATIVRLYDRNNLLDSKPVSALPPGLTYWQATPIDLQFITPTNAGLETHRLLRVVLDSPTNEISRGNNALTRRIYTGAMSHPSNSALLFVENVTVTPVTLNPDSTNMLIAVSLRAYYSMTIDGVTHSNLSAASVNVSATIATNGMSGSSITDGSGNARILFTSTLLPTGRHDVVISANDCANGYRMFNATATEDLLVRWTPHPSETWILSRDIHFEGPVDAEPWVETGAVFRIVLNPRYSLGQPQNVTVRLYDRYLSNGVWAADLLYQQVRSYSNHGVDYIDVTYTARVAGAHIIEAELAAGFGNPNNDRATRALLVGNLESEILVDLLSPASGEHINAYPYTARIRVTDLLGNPIEPADLAHLTIAFSQPPPYLETITVVSNGVQVLGAYNNGIYEAPWMPYAAPFGSVNALALAIHEHGDASEDRTVFKVGKSPSKLMATSDAFCPSAGANGEVVILDPEILDGSPFAPTGTLFFTATVHEPTGFGVYGYELHVSQHPDFHTMLWRSPTNPVATFMPTCGVGDGGRFWTIPYEGPPLSLSFNDEYGVTNQYHYYYWRIRFFDRQTNATPWSNQMPWGPSTQGQRFYFLADTLPPLSGCTFSNQPNPDGACDFDSDGLFDEQEIPLGTNPTNPDTDGDEQFDGFEVQRGTDPLDPASFSLRYAGLISYTGKQHGIVRVYGSYQATPYAGAYTATLGSPGSFTLSWLRQASNYYFSAYLDANNNNILDATEARGLFAGNPTSSMVHVYGMSIQLDDPDLDGNLLPDWWEIEHFGATGIDPGVDDEPDGLTRRQEYDAGTDPFDDDTDGDSFLDGHEVVSSSNPLDPASFPTTLSGSVTYTGSVTGPVRILVRRDDGDGPVIYTTTIPAPGAYTVTNVVTLSNYWIAAYRDANGNSAQGVCEPFGVYPANPAIPAAALTGIDIDLAEDTERPVLSGVPADTTAPCDNLPAPPAVTATDNWFGNVAVHYSQIKTAGCQSVVLRTWTATDPCGNSTNATQRITLDPDITPPALTIPGDVTVSCGQSIAPAARGWAAATDDCRAPMTVAYADTYITNTCTEVWLYRVWTATDFCANATIKTQLITIVDTTAPTLYTPPHLTIGSGESTNPVNTGMATATDGCDTNPVVTYSDAFSGPAETNVLLAEWTFPTGSNDAVADAGTDANTNRSIATVGGTGAIGFTQAGASDQAANATGWNNGADAKAWQVVFDATGYVNIRMSSKQYSSSTGPRDFKVQYSLDGSAWLDVVNVPPVTNNFTSGVINSHVLPAATHNQPLVYVRWIMTSNDRGGGTVTSAGNHRIDDIRFVADEMGSQDNLLLRTWTATDDCGHSTTAVQVITISTNWPFGGGAGTPADPYRIYTLAQLNNIRGAYLDKHFALSADIDASPTMTWQDGGAGPAVGFWPIGQDTNAFRGVFDGQSRSISGLWSVRPSTFNIALFGVTTNATIRNLALLNARMEGYQNVGTLVGSLEGTSRVEDCYSSGSVTCRNVVAGGLVSRTYGGSIYRSGSSAKVGSTGWGAAAGLVYHNGGAISNCYATGEVRGANLIAGLVGVNGAVLTDCFATGPVIATGSIVGGLVGNNHAGIRRCYASGNVSGNGTVGGLAGQNFAGSFIEQSFAVGNVTGNSSVGSLAGVQNGAITDCYWNNHAGNPANCYAGGNTGCTAIADDIAYFEDQANPPMSTWDFINIWAIPGGGGLPILP